MNDPVRKLPVWATAISAWRILASEWHLTLVLFVALALTFAVLWLPLTLEAVPIGPEETIAIKPLPFFWWIIVLVLYSVPLLAATAVVLVPLHRRILLGARESTGPFPFRIKRRELHYFLFLLSLSAAWTAVEIASIPAWGHGFAVLFNMIGTVERVVGPAAAFAASIVLPVLLVILIAAPMLYLSTRLSLALPAIAVAGRDVLSAAWRLGRGNGWRLAGTMVVAVLPALLAMSAFVIWTDEPATGHTVIILPDGETIPLEPARTEWPEAGPPPWTPLLLAPILAAFLLLEGAVLSVSYRALGGMDDNPTDSTAPTTSP